MSELDKYQQLITVWQKVIKGDKESWPAWVLFRNGTVVILKNATPSTDLKEEAMELMKHYGPVYPGSSAGDFNVLKLRTESGWVITCHHTDILTYVGEDEIAAESSNFVIGVYGRHKRDNDAKELSIIHVEEKL